MKSSIILVLLVLTISNNLFAQQIVKFYNYNFKPDEASIARYGSFVDHKDSVWIRQDFFLPERKRYMTGAYKDSALKIKHGKFFYYHNNGALETSGRYIDNKKEGLWISFSMKGLVVDSAVYNNGKVAGVQMRWYDSGYPLDSTEWAQDGTGVQVAWFEDGAPASSGRYNSEGKKHGKWQYYHNNGKRSALEVYNNGKRISTQYYNEQGNELPDTTFVERKVEYAGGAQGGKRYLETTLDANVPARNNAPAGMYTVACKFYTDTTGKVSGIEPLTNFGYGLEQEAVRVISKARNWTPAWQHGRKVNSYNIQLISFLVVR